MDISFLLIGGQQLLQVVADPESVSPQHSSCACPVQELLPRERTLHPKVLTELQHPFL